MGNNNKMTFVEKFHIATGGQFGDPSDEDLRPFAAGLLNKIGATTMTVEQVLAEPDLREMLVGEFMVDQEAKANQAEADEKAQVQAEAAEKVAQAKAEADRVRQAMFALKGISPEEQKKFAVTAWAKALANGETVEFPSARKHGEDDVCGAPDLVGCCSHIEKVLVWAILPNGEPPYGLCETLKSVYDELYRLSEGKAKVFLHSTSKVGLEAKASFRRDREIPVRTFVRDLAKLPEQQLPFIPQPKLDGDGKYLCSMGGQVPCCDGNQPAFRFPQWRGAVYGWCKNMAGAAWAELLSNKNLEESGGETARYAYRLKSAGTLDEAEKVVKTYLAHQHKNDQLLELARGYGRWDSAVPAPQAWQMPDGAFGCAAFKAGWKCCEGNRPAERGSHQDGLVTGFCSRSSKALYTAWLEMKKAHEESSEAGQPSNHLRTAEIGQALQWAENYNAHDNRSGDTGSQQSPLGNKTPPNSRQTHQRHKAEKSAKDKELRNQMRGSSNGSGSKKKGGNKGNRRFD